MGGEALENSRAPAPCRDNQLLHLATIRKTRGVELSSMPPSEECRHPRWFVGRKGMLPGLQALNEKAPGFRGRICLPGIMLRDRRLPGGFQDALPFLTSCTNRFRGNNRRASVHIEGHL